MNEIRNKLKGKKTYIVSAGIVVYGALLFFQVLTPADLDDMQARIIEAQQQAEGIRATLEGLLGAVLRAGIASSNNN